MESIARQLILDKFKRCGRCKRLLPISEFYSSHSKKDGLQYCCHKCSYMASRKWIEKNTTYVKVRRHKRYMREGQQTREKWREWRTEKLSAPDGDEWREKRRQTNRRACEKYRKNHPERRRASWTRRRSAKQASDENFTGEQWLELCEKYEHCCVACGERRKLTPDHIVPLSKGGSNGIDNIQPLCGHCNSAKRTKSTDYRR